MERSYTDLSWLKAWTEFKAEILAPGFELRPIIAPATTLYDCQICWEEDDGAVVITDIGGQAQPGWDPERGHGSVFKIYPDNRIDPIVPYGATGRAMIMSSIKSPANFGEYSNAVFPLGQLRPGRRGAHNTHVVYWVPPDAKWVEHYVIVPDAGSVNGGKSGALVGPGFGQPGTPEDGFLFVVSMFNCTMYKITSKREIWPWIIGDQEHSGIQFMPRHLFRASSGEHKGKLVCEGVANHSFSTPAPMPGQPRLQERHVWFIVEDQGRGQLAKLTPVEDGSIAPFAPPERPGMRAPQGFGPFGGQLFQVDMGTVNLMQTSTMPEEALPYDASVYRIDEKGERHVFIKNLQGGHPQVRFQGDRLLIGAIGKSFSTGDFHYPDGYLAEVVYVGT